MTDPIFTDPGAGRVATPKAPRPVDTTRTDAATGRLMDTLLEFGKAVYQHEQKNVVLKAQVDMARGFQQLVFDAGEAETFEETQEIFNNGSTKILNEIQERSIDGRTQDSLGLIFERNALRASAEVTGIVTKKKTDEFLSNMGERGDQIMDEVLASPTLDVTELKDELSALGVFAAESGAMSQLQKRKWVSSQRGRADLVKAMQLIQSSPQKAEDMLNEREGGDEGKFSNFTDLEPMDRLRLQAKAKASVKKEVANVGEVMQTNIDHARNGRPVESPGLFALRPGVTKSQIEDYAGNVEASTFAFSMVEEASFAPFFDASKFMQQIIDKAAPGQPNFQYFGSEIRWAQNQIALNQQRWNANPASMADATFPSVTSTALPGQDDKGLENRISNRYNAYEAKGLPRDRWKALTAQEASDITRGFMETAPDQKQSYIRAMMSNAGLQAPAMVQQLLSTGESGGHMPPEFVVIQDVNPLASSEVSKIVGVNATELRRAYSDPSEATTVEREMIDLFNTGIGRTLPDDPTQTGRFRDVSVRLALKMGDAEEAYTLLWGDRDLDGTVRWPRGLNERQKDFMVRRMDESLTDPVGFGLIPKTAAPEDIHTRKQKLLSAGEWITYPGPDGNDEGVALMWQGRPWLNAEGDEVRIPFSLALALPPPAVTPPPPTPAAAAELPVVQGAPKRFRNPMSGIPSLPGADPSRVFVPKNERDELP